jgi:hypothetical protein
MNKRRDALKAMMAPITARPMFGERQSSKTSGNGTARAMGLRYRACPTRRTKLGFREQWQLGHA